MGREARCESSVASRHYCGQARRCAPVVSRIGPTFRTRRVNGGANSPPFQRFGQTMNTSGTKSDGSHPSTVLIGIAFAAIYIIWGSTYLAIRIVVESMPAFLSAGIRF